LGGLKPPKPMPGYVPAWLWDDTTLNSTTNVQAVIVSMKSKTEVNGSVQ